MTIQELADELGRMYNTAPQGEQVMMIHLFGIKYADELRGLSLNDLAEQAGIPRSYGTEINKGRNLAKYVEPMHQVMNNARRRFLS